MENETNGKINDEAFEAAKKDEALDRASGLIALLGTLNKDPDQRKRFLHDLVAQFPDFHKPLENAVMGYKILKDIQTHRGSGLMMVNKDDVIKICLLAVVFYNMQQNDKKKSIIIDPSKPNGFISVEYLLILCFVSTMIFLVGASFWEVVQSWIK
jgi:hypothetical protein